MSVSTMNPSIGACCLWLTGLPGAGKTTLATHLHRELGARGVQSIVLDGDRLREGLNRDLGFSRDDRRENVRRISEVARLLVGEGFVVLVAAISPYQADRRAARERFATGTFIEAYIATDLATCMARDPKGLYALARAGKISHMTGWDDSYEPPEAPDVTLDTAACTVEQAVEKLMQKMRPGGRLAAAPTTPDPSAPCASGAIAQSN
jgi:adenylyl-sulfate kinase